MRRAAVIRWRSILMLLAATPASVWAQGPQTKEKGVAELLPGGYMIVQGEKEGKEIAYEASKGNKVRFTRDTISVFDQHDQQIYIIRYTLDESKKPCTISMTQTGGPRGKPGTKAKGVIKVEVDTATICYAEEGGTAPTSFQTKPGTKQHLFVMKRTRDEAAK